LDTLTSGQVQVSVEDKKKIDADYDKMRGLWKARKKMFKGVFDIIGESLPGKPAAFFEELGIETDEMVGMDINRDPL
jgi:26S proteasome regulatory subunit (ATPase 3-interacting protein)